MAELKFKYIEHSKCPHCGAGVESYKNYSFSEWEECISFKCGCSFRSETPTSIKETSMCENSKQFKKLKSFRLKELEKVRVFIQENVKDEKLLKEFINRLSSIDYNIREWWKN